MQGSCASEVIVDSRTVQEQARSKPSVDREVGMKVSSTEGLCSGDSCWERKNLRCKCVTRQQKGTIIHLKTVTENPWIFFLMYYIQPNNAVQERCQALPENWLQELQATDDFWVKETGLSQG